MKDSVSEDENADVVDGVNWDENEQDKKSGEWFTVMGDLVMMDKISSDEDIDVLKENVDLRIERMSEDSAFIVGYGEEVNYKYHFICTDDGLEIRREIIREHIDSDS